MFQQKDYQCYRPKNTCTRRKFKIIFLFRFATRIENYLWCNWYSAENLLLESVKAFNQARSQDLEKGGGGGGLFWKSEKSANDLDPNFHCPWISFTRFVRKLRRNFSESSEIQRFFPPKIRWSPKKKKKKKKKKKVFSEIETEFPAKIRNSKLFSAQKKVVSKKNKKKGLHQIWDWFFVQFRKFRRLRGGCFRMGGGYFQFFTNNRPQKHQKHAILHTSQANGGGSSPPAPPWLRYCIQPTTLTNYSIHKASINNFKYEEPEL